MAPGPGCAAFLGFLINPGPQFDEKPAEERDQN